VRYTAAQQEAQHAERPVRSVSLRGNRRLGGVDVERRRADDGSPSLRDFGATRYGALSKGRRGSCDDQVAGCAATLMTSRSAVSVLPLVSGPSSTEITTKTRKNIVLIIIGMAKPKFICTAR
jgi:hypothetical protein